MGPYQRLTTQKLPAYRFLPGKQTHPEKEGGHSYGLELTPEKLTSENYQSHPEYIFGLDLFNLGYYWESHVYWEAIWHKVGRKGETADLLKALIKLGAAGIKYKSEQATAGKGHLDRAKELFESLSSPQFLGINGLNFLQQLSIPNLNQDYIFNTYLVLNEK